MDSANIVLLIDTKIVVAGQEVRPGELAHYRRQAPQERCQRPVEMSGDVDSLMPREGLRLGKGLERLSRTCKVDPQLIQEVRSDLRRDQAPDCRVTVFNIVAFDSHRITYLALALSRSLASTMRDFAAPTNVRNGS